MASLYDAIEVKGSKRYRLNKMFIAEDKVPEKLKELITLDNIVDENGMVIVDQKNDEAKQPTEDNDKELGNKLARVDENKDESSEQDKSTDNPDTTLDNGETAAPSPAPMQIDDSANQNKEEEVQNDGSANDGGEDQPTPQQSQGPAPEVPTGEEAPKEPTPPPAEQPKAPTPEKPTRNTTPTVKGTKEPAFKSKVPQSSPGMGFPRKNGRTVDIFDLTTPHSKVKFVGGHAVPLSEESFRSRTEGEIQARLIELGFEIVDFNEIERQRAMEGAANPAGLMMEEDESEDDIQLDK